MGRLRQFGLGRTTREHRKTVKSRLPLSVETGDRGLGLVPERLGAIDLVGSDRARRALLFHQLQRTLGRGQGTPLHSRRFAVSANVGISPGRLGRDHDPHAIAGGLGHPDIRPRRLDGPPDAAEQVEFPGNIQARLVDALGLRILPVDR